MKPSERRALREQKRAETEAEAQRRATEKIESVNENEANSTLQFADYGAKIKKNRADGSYHTRKEGFFSKHAMLITAVIASAVVLSGAIVGVDLLVKYVNDNKYTVVDDKIDIDIASVYILHDYIDDVEWRHLVDFNYTDYSGKNNIIREYPIKGTDLVLRVGGPKNQKNPDFIHIRDYEPSEYIDISVDDPRYFFEERGFTAEEED